MANANAGGGGGVGWYGPQGHAYLGQTRGDLVNFLMNHSQIREGVLQHLGINHQQIPGMGGLHSVLMAHPVGHALLNMGFQHTGAPFVSDPGPLNQRNPHPGGNGGAPPPPRAGGGSGLPPRGGSGGGAGGRGGRGGAGGGNPPRIPAGGNMNVKALMRALGNSGKLGRAMTTQQYAGILNQLHSNILNLGAQNHQNLADINSWFGNAQSAQQAAHTANAQAAHDAASASSAQLAGLMQAVGANNNAADPLAAMGASNSTLLQALGQNQAGYDNNMHADIAASMASALANQQNAGMTALQNLKDQRNSVLQQRGASLITNTANAKQQKLQQMAALQNMMLANKQFGLNMALGMADLQNKNIVNKNLANGGAQGGHVDFNQLKSGDRIGLQKSIMPLMYSTNAAGQTVANQNPVKAWVQAANQLRTAGYNVQFSKAARSWLSTVWKNYVIQYNKAHPNTPYHPQSNGTPYSNQDWTH